MFVVVSHVPGGLEIGTRNSQGSFYATMSTNRGEYGKGQTNGRFLVEGSSIPLSGAEQAYSARSAACY